MDGADTVADRLADFHTKYGPFRIEQVEKSVPTENFEIALDDAGEMIDVRVWVEHNRCVLLIRDQDAPEIWMEPGGTPDSAEEYEVTACRETAEETGINCTITGLRGIVRHNIRNESDPSTGVQLLQIFYEAEYHAGDLTIQADEICEGQWWSTLPKTFHSALGAPESFQE